MRHVYMLLAEAYAVLGLSDNCTPDQVRAAYKRQVLAHHPDKGGREEDFVRVTQAYECALGEKVPSSIRGDLFGGIWELLARHRRKSELTIRINVDIDVREVYAGAVKKLSFRRRLRDGKEVIAKSFIGLSNFKH